MKILLVEIHKGEEVWNGLGIGYLYAFLTQKGYEVHMEILHEGSNAEEFIDMAKKEEYPLIGFSSSFYNSFDFALTTIVKLKRTGIKSHIIIGGHTPTSCYKRVMEYFPEVDSIALGEGEETLLELIEKFYNPEKWDEITGLVFRKKGAIITNPPRKLIEDLDTIPYPHRKQYIHKELECSIPIFQPTLDYAMKKRMMVTTSRGCYGRCTFCSVYHFYNYNVRRGRTVENVADEIEELVNKYGARIIAFNDDNFFDPHDREYKWYYSFADELEKRNLNIIFNFQCRPNDINYDLFHRLKQVGLHYVFLGTESFIQRTLKLFKKGLTVENNFKALSILKKLDLNYQVGLIVFEPFTTFEEVKESFRIIKSLYDDYNYSSPLWIDRLRVYYGTKIQEILEEENILEGEFPYYSYKIKDEKVEALCNAIQDAIWPFTANCTEKETLLSPQTGNLLFLWGISYLKDLPDIKKGEFNYLPVEKVKELSIESSRVFIDLINKGIELFDKDKLPEYDELHNYISYFRAEYSGENDRILDIFQKEALSV